MRRPGIVMGAGVGLLLTAPLIVVFALGNQLAGLPFIPYDVFPFVRDLTPGPVLTATIDTMVGVISTLNLGRIDTAAKVAEQAMAILMVVGFGVIAGALFFGLMRASSARTSFVAGLAFGLLVGIVMALISSSLGLSARTNSAAANTVWIVLLFAVWGLAHGWALDQLSSPEPAVEAPARALR